VFCGGGGAGRQQWKRALFGDFVKMNRYARMKKAWEVALAPLKQLPMTAIMMYMSGNSLQIFSIMMVVMAFKNPLMGLVATGPTFERFESEGTRQRLVQVKAVYVLMQVLALALGVWKVDKMGLLPWVFFASLSKGEGVC